MFVMFDNLKMSKKDVGSEYCFIVDLIDIAESRWDKLDIRYYCSTYNY